MRALCGHLAIHQSLVRAGTELSPHPEGWAFLRICAGQGYLMDGAVCTAAGPGDLIVIPAVANACVRASQLNDLRLCHFGVQPKQLLGFFTAEEQQALQTPPRTGARSARVIGSGDATARLYADLCEARQCEPGVMVRSAMLSLAVRSLREILAGAATPKPRATSPEQRLAELASLVPESDLLTRPVAELARACGCGERHLRRLFADRFGAPLLQRQIQWRIEQAKQLLVQTDAKIIDVAGQCGFCSLSRFNAAFKRLTRQSPGTWRATGRIANAQRQRRLPSLCPRTKGPARSLSPAPA